MDAQQHQQQQPQQERQQGEEGQAVEEEVQQQLAAGIGAWASRHQQLQEAWFDQGTCRQVRARVLESRVRDLWGLGLGGSGPPPAL